jgi:hypothetical protein
MNMKHAYEQTRAVCCVDYNNRILEANEDWFAFYNGVVCPGLPRDAVVGGSVLRFTQDRTRRELIRIMLDKCRISGRIISYTARIDTPELIVSTRTTLTPCGGEEIQITERVERVETPERPVDPGFQQKPLTLCRCCGRVRIPGGQWTDIAEACDTNGLFTGERAWRIVSGLCSTCHLSTLSLAAEWTPVRSRNSVTHSVHGDSRVSHLLSACMT